MTSRNGKTIVVRKRPKLRWTSETAYELFIEDASPDCNLHGSGVKSIPKSYNMEVQLAPPRLTSAVASSH